QKLAPAGRRRRRQRVAGVVDLQHGAREVMPVLPEPTAERQHMVEGKAELALVEGEHRLELVGVEADVEPGLGELHARPHEPRSEAYCSSGARSVRSVLIGWLSSM